MAEAFYYFKGTAYWTKIKKPDTKYECYSVDLFPDDESLGMFKDSGLQLKIHENEEGKFIRFRRPMFRKTRNGVIELGPPQTLLKGEGNDYKPFDDYIGNGSTVTIKVRVYDTDRGKGHELVVVAVDELVAYEAAESFGGEDLPF